MATATTTAAPAAGVVEGVFKAGNTALITGGASGIGLAMAKKCWGFGMNVVIVDNDKEALKAVEMGGAFGKGFGEKVVGYEMDVSRIEEWRVLKGMVEGRFGQINLLHLNAGIGLKSTWTDITYFQKIMSVNLFGVINGISTFLPTLQSQAQATTNGTSSPITSSSIIITGSKQGITNPPGNPAYNASKSAIKTLAEHLSYDLKDTPNISVHLLVPGWTFTGLTGGGGLKEKPAGAWSAEQVVEFLLRKMGEGRFYVVCPDNDVDEVTDKKRMLWGVGDVVEGRLPLSRWREEYKGEAEEWMARVEI